MLSASDRIEGPRADLEWRTMTKMLVVATGELGDPVAEVILVVTGNRPLHAVQLTLRTGRSPIAEPHPSRHGPSRPIASPSDGCTFSQTRTCSSLELVPESV